MQGAGQVRIAMARDLQRVWSSRGLGHRPIALACVVATGRVGPKAIFGGARHSSLARPVHDDTAITIRDRAQIQHLRAIRYKFGSWRLRHLILAARIRWLAEALDLAGGSAAFVPVVVRRRRVHRVLPSMSAARGRSNVAVLAGRIPIVRPHGSNAQ